MIFNNYAKYYDLLYKDKDYKSEIDYIDSLIKKYSNKENISILDIGCGTGIHANYLAEKGYQVTGIDFSEEMIQIANGGKNKNTEFFVYDATNFQLEKKFDIILSLFHVVSYQTTNLSIESLFSNVSNHLHEKGLLIFDFWYGPAVITERPSVKIKRLENDEIKIVRIAEPEMGLNNNLVNVNYELIIFNKAQQRTDFINEIHTMRYFFIPEVDYFLQNCKMKALHYEEWLTGKEPASNTWGVCCIADQI